MNHHGLPVKLILAGVSGCLLLAVAGVQQVRAQSPDTSADWERTAGGKMSFDVASIKLSDATDPLAKRQFSPDRFAATDVTAIWLIATAYKVKDFQIEGAPAWAKASKFDVDAKVQDSVARDLQRLPRIQQVDELRMMLQSLLAGRFKLQATRQTKAGPIYALVIAKGGPKLPQPRLPSLSPEDRARSWQNLSLQTTMPGLASFLAGQPDVRRVVVDQTGLTGEYNFTLKWSNDTSGGTGAPGITIFEAIQEQLGLKLESRTGPVDTIIIDHIEEPTPN